MSAPRVLLVRLLRFVLAHFLCGIVFFLGLCTIDKCFDFFWDEVTACDTYREGGAKVGRCGIDGRCRKCSCSCHDECTGENREGPCDGDAEPDWDSDDVSLCHILSTDCKYSLLVACPTLERVCARHVLIVLLLCPLARYRHLQVCADEDSCPFDPENDVDGDGVCSGELGVCIETEGLVNVFGDCASYAFGGGGFNDGLCSTDGVCGACPCSCDGEAGCPIVSDPCPRDAEDDEDSDSVCGDVDSCPSDSSNDSDGDNLCADVDSCPADADNDADDDMVCGDIDVCPFDAADDVDGDGVCGDVDLCNDLTNVGTDCPPTTSAPTTTTSTDSASAGTQFAFGLSEEEVIGISVAAGILFIIIVIIIVVVVLKKTSNGANKTMAVSQDRNARGYKTAYGVTGPAPFSPSAAVEVEIDDDNETPKPRKRVQKSSSSKATSEGAKQKSGDWTCVSKCTWLCV